MAIDIDAIDKAFADVQTVVAASKPKAALADFVDPANLHLFPRQKRPKEYDGFEIGSEGLERTVVLDEQVIFGKGGCGVLRNALITSGAHQDQPQWRLTCLALSFLKNPRQLAHALNKGKGYSIAGTEGMMDRVDNDKASRKGGMGWPGCDKFEQYGCGECAACPHRGKVRSPLNLGIVKQDPNVQPAQTHSAVTFAGNQIYPGFNKFELPDNYVFNASGHVCLVVEEKEKTADGIETKTILMPLLEKQYILDPHVQQRPDALLFTVDGSKGELRPVMLERGTMASPLESARRLSEQGVALNPILKQKAGDFMASLTRRIEMERQSANARPFGWVRAEGADGYDKFIYAKTFHRDGKVTDGGYLNETMRQLYGPCGRIEPWLKAAKFVLAQGRMEYTAFLASTFAAPLMVFTGQPLVLFAMAGDSGIGKSTVLKIAAALWGHPDDSRLTFDPTLNAAGHKMGTLAHLPVYFDEVTELPAMENCLKIASMDGGERARLFAAKSGGLHLRESGHWNTLLCTTGNRSLLDFVSTKQRDTAMGRRRVFEINAYRRGDEHLRDHYVGSNMTGDLRFSFGHGGLIYGAFLATVSADLKEMLEARGRAFDKLVKTSQEERFWSVLCACLLLGAEFAKKLGLVDFDLPALEAYLVTQFIAQRDKCEADGQEGDGVAIELLSAFMKEHMQHMLVTDGLPRAGGKLNAVPFNIIRQPGVDRNKGIYIQWVDRKEDALLRISREQLLKWMERNERQPSVILARLGHRVEKVVLGGKTPYAALPERVVEFDVQRGGLLRDALCDLVSRCEDPAPAPSKGEQAVFDAAAAAKKKDQSHDPH